VPAPNIPGPPNIYICLVFVTKVELKAPVVENWLISDKARGVPALNPLKLCKSLVY
jgi:hypothetical protein